MSLEKAIKSISQLTALVVGDVMLDAYLFGKVERMSPEAPVPVVLTTGRDERVGGAANVAKNIIALGAKVELATVIGNDSNGERLKDILISRGIGTRACLTEKGRPTTVKTRVISDNEHMLRVDEETEEPISTKLTLELTEACISLLNNAKIDVIIIEDYDKGVLTAPFIKSLISEANSRNIPIAVDPKLKNFHEYLGVDLFKPNLKELREGLNLQVDTKDNESLKFAINKLHKTLKPKCSLTTLGSVGVWINAPELGVNHVHLQSRPSNVIDVSGAGDTVIAVAALMLAAGSPSVEMGQVSNCAGGQVCEHSGVVSVDLDLVISELKEASRV